MNQQAVLRVREMHINYSYQIDLIYRNYVYIEVFSCRFFFFLGCNKMVC